MSTGGLRSATRGGTSAVARWWRSRLGRPLVREVVTVAALLTLYRLGRYLGRDSAAAAFDNARDVLALERWLGIANEHTLQDAVLGNVGLVEALNRYYVTAHFPLTVAFLVVLYLRAGHLYPHVRRLFVAVTAAGLVLHLAYPLAPPRMLPGFVDTVAVFGPSIYDDPGVASVANQHAAMPSLHFGWAVLVAYGTVLALSTRARWVVVAHPVVTLLAIVLTANHFWMDAIVAGMLIVGARAFLPPPQPARSTPASSTPACNSP